MFRWLRQWFDPGAVRQVGTTPDYRFSLANERTFLAWIRTALALIAGGLAAAQFLPPLPAIRHFPQIIAVVLLLLGATVAVRAVGHYALSERAMRLNQDLPASRFPAVLAVLIGLGTLLLVIALLVQAVQSR